jgi:hypothetical protein
VLSFDLALGPVNHRGALALERLAARGTRIAWGVVAAHRVEEPDAAARRLTKVLARMPSTADAGLLTPSCGTGRLSVARERDGAAILRELAVRLAYASPSSPRSRFGVAPEYRGRGGQRSPVPQCTEPSTRPRSSTSVASDPLPATPRGLISVKRPRSNRKL